MSSHATSLRCLRCGTELPVRDDAYLCPACGRGDGMDAGVLEVGYDYPAVAARFAAPAEAGLFGFAALLPAGAPPRPLLPVGGTPLRAAPGLAERVGVGELWLKDETVNPTGSFKDRATAMALALALARGSDTLFCASAGNAALSLAGFCADAGLGCHVWVPAGSSAEGVRRLRDYGATVHLSAGDYDCAYDEAEAEGSRQGWYSRNCAFNPFLVEGKKTAAFEIAAQLGRTPDWVAAPVGDGCTLAALGKGFRELREVGKADAQPRLLGAQAEGVQPLVRRFQGLPAAEAGRTRASSIAVRRPRNALRLLRELRAGGGTLLAVPDAEMAAAQGLLERAAGVRCELTSAASLAALRRLARERPMREESVVLVITAAARD